MHIGFLNPQGNFDRNDSHWTKHPDFGGQLVYVKLVAMAMALQGHQVDILTRQIIDPDWPEFAEKFDFYPDLDNLRIVRLPAGPKGFLSKESLWPHLVQDWIPNILEFYREEGALPEIFTTHYGDGGLCGVLIYQQTRVPFTFTGHSLGAQKMDKLEATPENLAEIDEAYNFKCRIMAERLSMNYSAINITSTRQERLKQYGHRAYWGAVDVSDESRFAVIPPGSNLSVFGCDVSYEKDEETEHKIQIYLGRDIAEERRELPAIVASSRLDPKKNHIGLVEAFARSERLQEKANLVIFTSGFDDPLNQYEKIADQDDAGVLAQIIEVVEANSLWGKISAFSLDNQFALAAAYRFFAGRRSLFALTALYEPFGLAPLEAAAAGLPVVVTKNGGPSESFREGDREFGVLVDPTDPDDIAKGLERILCNPEEWEKFAESGKRRVCSRYTWASTAEGYLNQIEKILASPPEPSQKRLPIPAYFYEPELEKEISLEELSNLYFGNGE